VLAGCSSGSGDGWTITVYYTAVESFHTGTGVKVTGCPKIDCTRGDTDLGTYPRDFVQAVHDEGTGRITGGRYLNWSYDTGYWLDDAPRDTAGRPLRPWVSAAADPSVLKSATRFTVTDCGKEPPPAAVCGKLKAARWEIVDEFTPGLGGDQHLDLYIGEETGPGFTESDWYTTLTDATVKVAG
jgi:hypothetical protein